MPPPMVITCVVLLLLIVFLVAVNIAMFMLLITILNMEHETCFMKNCFISNNTSTNAHNEKRTSRCAMLLHSAIHASKYFELEKVKQLTIKYS